MRNNNLRGLSEIGATPIVVVLIIIFVVITVGTIGFAARNSFSNNGSKASRTDSTKQIKVDTFVSPTQEPIQMVRSASKTIIKDGLINSGPTQ